MNDEELAKRLQEMEFSEQKRLQNEQRIRDEEYARKLAWELSEQPNTSTRPLSGRNNPTQAPSGQIFLVQGEQATVRLHNYTSGHSIGEVFNLVYLEQNRIRLELQSRPGFFMRVSDSGKVEYSSIKDLNSKFIIEMIPGTKNVYILPEAHITKFNSQGLPSWVLALLPDGKFIGNGCRGALSQWALLAASNSSPSPTLQSTPSVSSTMNPLHNPPPSSSMATSSSARGPFETGLIEAPVIEQNIFELLNLGIHLTVNQQLQWLETPIGQSYLAEKAPGYIKYLYTVGILRSFMHRPDWMEACARWKDYPSQSYPMDTSVLQKVFPLPLQQEFFDTGSVIVPHLASNEMLSRALRLALYGTSHNLQYCKNSLYGRLELTGALASDADFLTLFYDTPLVHIAQKLIGAGEIRLPPTSRVSLIQPSLITQTPNLDGKNWMIDGFTEAGAHSPYTLLIGVALTDMSIPNSGNHCVYLGSHMLLQEHYKMQVQTCGYEFSFPRSSSRKPRLEDAKQLLLKAGDAFLCTHRLAYIFSPNITDHANAIVYFEIIHIDHEALKMPALDGIWVEFKGINDCDRSHLSGSFSPLNDTRSHYSVGRDTYTRISELDI